MADHVLIENIVDNAVSQVLDSQMPQLRQELVRRVLEQIQPQLQAQAAAPPVPGDSSAEGLLNCVGAIQSGTTQKEVLRALLDNTVHYSGRSALFVVKAGSATGWEARGFSSNDDVKDFPLDVASEMVSKAVQSRVCASGTINEVDPRFASHVGAPADDHAVVVPLVLKDKVAALLYADSGKNGRMDSAALQLLVKATGAWLEVALLRKQTTKDAGPEPEDRSAAVPVQTVTSFSDPFAGHAPLHTARPEIPPVEAAAAAAAGQSSGGGSAAAQVSADDADVHRKAQRFARLLVDEIKLYNQAKVTEGRKNRDLYDRLKEDIEKSRSTYQKRYGNTPAASGDYFNTELVRSLAEDDVSIMGAGFRR